MSDVVSTNSFEKSVENLDEIRIQKILQIGTFNSERGVQRVKC